ncbi:MAG: Asp-tRNA(Asn)/Glu-tRNA(Gln) amidotransferase GatCAB subunit B, partial [Firmicutes bacterium]|nr:Asp-tRNA(Asn)/Glu-tRNA(Gln) amidotransferase GatCAB subunit B [Bacillota bacterium]
NLSLRPEGQERFGTRTEMKNINSFRAAVRAMESEILRQKELLEDGKEVVQSTRRWDDEKGMSYEMRSKEESHDDRYFPEPDLVPIVISQEWLESIRSTLPELPAERRKRYTAELGLSDYDAAYLTSSKKLSDFFEDVIRFDVPAKSAANQLIGDIQRILRERNIETIPFAPQRLAEVIRLTENGTISSSAAKKVVEVLFETDDDPKEIAKKLGLLQLNDVTALQGIVEKVLWENPRAVKEYQSGKEKAFGFLVGQVMRLSKGSGNPKLITEILKSELCGGEQK